MKYKVKKIADKIYYLEFKDRYDLGMLFCRYQEFYESPNKNFRNKQFTLVDYMEWWAKTGSSQTNNGPDGCFTYPEIWSGFNLPSYIIDNINTIGILDKNKYDDEMLSLHTKLKEESDGDYYLIGTMEGNVGTLAHEISHSLFYVNKKFKAKMEKLVSELDKSVYTQICDWLENRGYTEEVFVDETQAYLATGFSEKIADKKIYKPFLKTYKKYSKDIECLVGWERE